MKPRILFLSLFVVILVVSIASAEVPQMINYQGKLTDTLGALIDTTVSIEFAIYSDSSGMTAPLWSETHDSVKVEYGIFSVLLGSVDSIPFSVFDGDVRYLGISVGGDSEMRPLKPIVSVAYAIHAGTVDSGKSTGSTFIRWGNWIAPVGSELVYSGYGYASHYEHTGSNIPIVLHPGDPGPIMVNDGDRLYPLTTYSNSVYMPPGITEKRYIRAAVCYSDRPTVTIWGTHIPPTGWQVLYRGYSMGGHNVKHGPTGPICVESDYFDDSDDCGSELNLAWIYGTRLWAYSAPGDSDLENKFVKCMICKKE